MDRSLALQKRSLRSLLSCLPSLPVPVYGSDPVPLAVSLIPRLVCNSQSSFGCKSPQTEKRKTRNQATPEDTDLAHR